MLDSNPIEASAPCRIDMGGTLDIPTFYYPLRHLDPCTFNIALGLRTRVRLQPYTKGVIKISSRGFKDAEFQADAAPFDHPLGLMFATAAYFNAGGVHIDIESGSPPRSALGGSSVAAVALVAALSALFQRVGESDNHTNRRLIALLACKLEEAVAGVLWLSGSTGRSVRGGSCMVLEGSSRSIPFQAYRCRQKRIPQRAGALPSFGLLW